MTTEQQPNDRALTATDRCFLLCRPTDDGVLTWKALEKIAGQLPRMPIAVDLASGDLWMSFRLPENISTPMRELGPGMWLVDGTLAPTNLQKWLDDCEAPELPVSWRLNFRSLDIG